MEYSRHTSKARDRQARKRVAEFIALAVLIHLALAPVLAILIPDPEPLPIGKRKHRVAMLTSKQVNQIKKKQLEKKLEKKKKKPPEEEKKNENLDGQVVDLPPSPDDTAPEDAKYLSEHNTRTERETASRHRRADYQNPMNELSRAEKNDNPNATPEKATAALEVGPEEPKPTKKKEVAGTEKAFEVPDIQARDKLALKFDPELGKFKNQSNTEALRGNSSRLKLSLGDDKEPSESSKAPKRGPTMADLVPKVGVLARLSGGPANDHLQDVEEGEGTFLNSREFKYASFFNRMKRGVSQHWRPLNEYRRRDPTGNIYGQRARVTVLQITLNPDGSLQGVEVNRSSGVDFLDREAIAAFQRAEPFPNPPSGLVDKDSGVITFPFGFHIEFSSRGLRLPF